MSRGTGLNLRFSMAGLFVCIAVVTTAIMGVWTCVGMKVLVDHHSLNVFRYAHGEAISPSVIGGFDQTYLILATSACLVTCAIGILLGLYFARAIGRPLMSLMNRVERLQRLELQDVGGERSRIAEITSVEKSIDNLQTGLRSFRKFVPAGVVEELFRTRKEAVLGVRRRMLSISFSDIAGFTGLAEMVPAEQLIEELGAYFQGMTETIHRNGGVVDKYIGDAIMALWGAPKNLDAHAVAACRAALQCQRLVYGLSREWQRKGLPALVTRTGVHTGEAFVGNVGYADRLNYTAVGDDVNTASRLEGLNKFYGTEILVSHKTWELVHGDFEMRLIDHVVVKGKVRHLPVYELVAEKGTLDRSWHDFARQYQQGMERYLAREWTEATDAFAGAVRMNPGDRPASIMHERCRTFSHTPPPAGWQGAIYMRGK